MRCPLACLFSASLFLFFNCDMSLQPVALVCGLARRAHARLLDLLAPLQILRQPVQVIESVKVVQDAL